MGLHLDLRLDIAVKKLAAGGIVAHACEGVWGLACDPFRLDTVSRLLALKGRRFDKGLIVIASSAADFAPEFTQLDENVAEAVRASWPGPETWVVPNVRFANIITGNRATVAIRVPGHAQARALARKYGGPLVSTSANRAGHPPARTELRVRRRMGARVDYVLPGAVGDISGPTRVRIASSGERLR